jgi:cytidylate kinase
MSSHSIGQLVESQARRWEKAKLDAQRKEPAPSVAISRLPYSGATEIAEKLALRLEYGLFGREIVDQIASEEGISRNLVSGLDEHVENAIERHILDGFRHRKFSEEDYLRDTVRIVTTLGLRGHTVIVGRGSACILPAERTLRVLVVAPREWRLARLQQIHELGEAEAEERLTHEDAGRVEFWKRSFQVDVTDAGLYDVVVNAGTLSIDGATDLVEAAFKHRFNG